MDGNIICDLEQHRPLDLLPDREVATVVAWLKQYPSIEVISMGQEKLDQKAGISGIEPGRF